MHMDTGIYSITSPSGKRYIGSATSIKKRWMLHKSALRRGVHHANALQNACSKYSLEKLVFEKLLICSKEQLGFYEQLLLTGLSPEYNSTLTAFITFGMKRPEVSAKLTGRKHTEESLALMRNLTPEQHESRRQAGIKGGALGGLKGKGKSKSPETRRLMSEAAKKRNFVSHFNKEYCNV